MKFKIGDTVKRILTPHIEMKIGNTGIIEASDTKFNTEWYKIKGYKLFQCVFFLKLVKSATINWRERLSK